LAPFQAQIELSNKPHSNSSGPAAMRFCWALALSCLAGTQGVKVGVPESSLLQEGAGQKSAEVMMLEAGEQIKSGNTRAALAGFQKFTDQLVATYGKVGARMNNDTSQAILTVIAYMDTLYDYLVDWHDSDKARAEKCEQHLDRCQDDHLGDATVLYIEGLEVTVNSSRKAHLECRHGCDACPALKDQACKAYDDYRTLKGSAPDRQPLPGCAQQDLSDAGVSADEGQPLTNMEQCLTTFEQWFDPLYEYYINCTRFNCEACEDDCGSKQQTFEEHHCQWSTSRVDHCHAFGVCWNHTVIECDTDCSDIAINVDARKAQNETGERIECLLYVLLADNQSKPGNLEACKDTQYNTSEFDLSCHEDGTPWPPVVPEKRISCDSTEVPCTDDFVEVEYSNVTEGNCKACLTLETHFWFKQDGKCEGQDAKDESTRTRIGACAAHCHDSPSCDMFAWTPDKDRNNVSLTGGNCFLYSSAETCDQTVGFSPFVAYILQFAKKEVCPWSKPFPGNVDQKLCADGSRANNSEGCNGNGEGVHAIQCPLNAPAMCANLADDYACVASEAECDGNDLGGLRACATGDAYAF